jgi:hypothetical protein
MSNFPEGLMVIPPGTLQVGDRDESTTILEIVWGQVTLALPAAGPLAVVSATAALAAIDTGKAGTWEVFVAWAGGYADGMWTDLCAAIATAGGIVVTGLNTHTGTTASATTGRTATVLAIRH